MQYANYARDKRNLLSFIAQLTPTRTLHFLDRVTKATNVRHRYHIISYRKICRILRTQPRNVKFCKTHKTAINNSCTLVEGKNVVDVLRRVWFRRWTLRSPFVCTNRRPLTERECLVWKPKRTFRFGPSRRRQIAIGCDVAKIPNVILWIICIVWREECEVFDTRYRTGFGSTKPQYVSEK